MNISLVLLILVNIILIDQTKTKSFAYFDFFHLN